MKDPKRYTVTAALPYANGPVHIGHLAGCYLPSDIYVRFLRQSGKDVKFICGSDEHGVAITIKAKKEGISPQDVVDKYHNMMKNAFADFGIGFDVYSRTSSEIHKENATEFFKNLYDKGVLTEQETEQYFDEEANQFLADRYITGTCPVCSTAGAYGDQCESCGSTLNPTELLNPQSTLSGATPVLRKTKNWFLPLDKLSGNIRNYLEQHKDWKPNVYGQCMSWLNAGDGLQPRSMTRDLDWGVPVPVDGAEGKVLYVWFDAPIGYISATRELLPETWETWWKDPETKLVHFIGKDNIVFHCVIFPAILMEHGDYILADEVPANEFLNLEGDKISTSRNWAVWLHEYLEDFPGKQDVLRYALTATMPETKDNDFTWKDFQQRNNNELVADLGNLINRVLVLTNKYYNGVVPQNVALTAEDEAALAKAREALPGVKVRFGYPSEFAEAILAEEKANPTLPVIRGDMPNTWVHGQMSSPEPTKIHRQATGALVTLGQLDSTLQAFGVATEPVAGPLDLGYRNGGFYTEHTWGINGLYFRGEKLYQPDWQQRYEAGEYKKFDDTYEYHMDYGRNAMKAAQEGIAPRIAALAQNVKMDGPRVVVFNPLPWERDALVSVDLPEGLMLPGATRSGKTVTFLAKGLPPGGYKAFAVKAGGEAKPLTGSLKGETKIKHFTARFDLEKGGISSLIENATGRELVKQGGHVLGQFLHERFSLDHVKKFLDTYPRDWGRSPDGDFAKGGMPGPDKSPYAAMTPTGWKATHTRTSIGEEVVLTPTDTLGLAKGYELRFSFPDDPACVDISWKVVDKTPTPIPEGGWICLPFNVQTPSFRVGRIGGTIDPVKDIIFGSNRNLMGVDRAITVRSGENGAGVAAASADLPLWSIGKPGLWLYEPSYVPTEPELFVNLYNNMWNTNFPLWIPGSWEASLRVWPVPAGATEEQANFTPSWELRQPPVAAFADGKPGSLPPTQAGVALSRKGVRVSAFCPNPDGPGMVLRVWEQSGQSGPLTVTLPTGTKAAKAQPVNLRGEPAGEPIPIINGQFTVPLGAWAPASFILP